MTIRKIAALLLCLALAAGLWACGDKAEEPAEDNTAQAASAQKEEPGEEQKEEQKEEASAKIPADAAKVLAGIAYFGDPGDCRMSRENAEAFYNVLQEKKPSGKTLEGSSGDLLVLLADVSGDGFPVMLTVYAGEDQGDNVRDVSKIEVWEFRDGKAKQVNPSFETAAGYTGLDIMTLDGQNYLKFQDGVGFEIGDCTGWVSYGVDSGKADLAHRVMMYSGYSEGSDNITYRDAGGNACTATVSDLIHDGWTLEQDDIGDYYAFAYYLDGDLDYNRVEEIQGDAGTRNIGFWGDVPMLSMQFSSRDEALAALAKIAGK
ncbi:MAG: hypothetical protein IJG57_01380 [Firmicutes bacterium]|nr:hypothetical protein [Bacillota bacterium]